MEAQKSHKMKRECIYCDEWISGTGPNYREARIQLDTAWMRHMDEHHPPGSRQIQDPPQDDEG